VIKHHVMKIYGEVKVKLHTFLNSSLYRIISHSGRSIPLTTEQNVTKHGLTLSPLIIRCYSLLLAHIAIQKTASATPMD